MEKQNKVSVWIGKFTDKASFENYVRESYNDDGEMVSNFMKDFEIDFYDEDLSESCFVEHDDLSQINDFSYAVSFMKHVLDNVTHQNSFKLLYDFDYVGENKDSSKLKFIGSFDYVKD